ncbi:hypothetical protein SERLA73DRAFT_185658 [Serpula lacrymans var. lacrymans S7.3]|uniref:Uncharacterized protein n=2 Tax=Serpula lacrymans var. lacrymans TaxID=341189 RepID=F8Q672_SERL3|nr:uncharacterized protein SERLADRAFT_474256 [Serpula lacrymans var. lacrymans S7.9]EGN96110.1 hypothetical protein SERLA73DRAFT_185658 [Serpula lacrymans var. lacrymans S7.3]EGO21630.1 hypothetical protein SERLADRAFT_474256 [Serpula lacrymans var. lacrymans S7.9]
MRPSIARFFKILPMSAVKPSEVLPPPLTKQEEKMLKKPLLKVLMERQKEQGDSWPKNLRIEPHVTRKAIGKVHPSIRSEMKELLREK